MYIWIHVFASIHIFTRQKKKKYIGFGLGVRVLHETLNKKKQTKNEKMKKRKKEKKDQKQRKKQNKKNCTF